MVKFEIFGSRPAIERPGLESRHSRIRLFFQRMISNSLNLNSNIIEGVIRRKKYYFALKEFEMQKNNAFNKFYFYLNFFSYRFIPNFEK